MDIGIYFEANGHGTVHFSEKFVSQINLLSNVYAGLAPEVKASVEYLKLFRELINESVGDAIADMLAVESILKYYDWSEADWLSQYTEIPNRLTKVKVADNGAYATDADDESICVKPEGLQAAIDAEAAKVAKGRAFVRPSGTEPVLRVYAEAETEKGADALMAAVKAAVAKFD